MKNPKKMTISCISPKYSNLVIWIIKKFLIFFLLTILCSCKVISRNYSNKILENQNTTLHITNNKTISSNYISNATQKKDREIIVELKKSIKKQVANLFLVLNSEYQDLSYQKEWLDKKDISQSSLLKFTKVDCSNTRVLKDIQNYFMKEHRFELSYAAFLLLNTIETLQNTIIESKIKEYFKLLHKVNPGSIRIIEKTDGIQFGKIAEVYINKKQIIKYYIKTHEGGLFKYTDKRTHTPVNPIEIFTYKVLEYSGFGPEVHFFYDNSRNFYIATKDVSLYSSSPDNKNFTKHFEDFFLNKSSIKNEYKQAFNSIITGIMSINIIQKIMNLTDLMNNDKNVMFVKCSNKDDLNYWCVKILDFRNKWEEGYPDGMQLFYGLVEGNGQYNYLGQDNKIISFYLGTKNLSFRLEHTKNFDYSKLLIAIKKAEKFMINYMKENANLFKNTKKKVFEYISNMKQVVETFEKSSKTLSIRTKQN